MKNNIDVVHMEKNLVNNLFYMLRGVKGKINKDDDEGHKNIGLYCNRSQLELIGNRNHPLMLKATYSISLTNDDLACCWIKILKFLDSYASNITNCADEDYKTFLPSFLQVVAHSPLYLRNTLKCKENFYLVMLGQGETNRFS